MEFKTVLIILFIFFVGFFTGGFSMGQYIKYEVEKTRHNPGERLKQRLKKVLDPSTEQVEAIRPILKEHMKGYRTMRESHKREVDGYMEMLPKKLNPHLDQEQNKRLIEELDRASKRWRKKGEKGKRERKP